MNFKYKVIHIFEKVIGNTMGCRRGMRGTEFNLVPGGRKRGRVGCISNIAILMYST